MGTINVAKLWVLGLVLVSTIGLISAQCGKQANGTSCFLGECCSQYGYCGTGDEFCGAGCQNGACNGTVPGPAPGPVVPEPCVADFVSEELFDEIFPIRNSSFYTYASFIAAANYFKGFGTTGGAIAQRREVAALFAHITLETDGLYYINEVDPAEIYCDTSCTQYPCVAGQSYHGRGPLQLSWNSNYGPAGVAMKKDLLADPDCLSTDPAMSWMASLWFWNTASGNKPSCHDVITGQWKPSAGDTAAGRLPGFGVTIDIMNGGLECDHESPSADNRVKYYQEIANIFGVDPGQNLDCINMEPF